MTGDPPHPASDPTSSGPFHLMFLRVSPEDFIIYANSALAAYIGMPKDVILGAPFEEFRKRLQGEMQDCFQRPERGRGSNRLVTDGSGRVFEARTISESGVLDIVLNEVTNAQAAFGDLLRSTGTPIESLTEEEIRIMRQADRRFATVTVAQMRGLGAMANRLPPHEMQLMVNAFAEEMSEAILATGSTVGQMSGDRVTGIFGAPRHHRDHALRAVTSACLQIDRIGQLHDAFSKQGRELPPCSIAIASGEMLLAIVEATARRACHALGDTVELATTLSRLARPGEVVLTENTLQAVLANLPEGWEHFRADTETEPDLTGFPWEGGEIEVLPQEMRRIAWLVGPGVLHDPTHTELYFDYLYAIADPEGGQSLPILRVVRPQNVGSSIELDQGNVVTTTAAMFLGKYRLIKVVGEGGMGKVWQAQDRFDNTIAIKVLNTADAATTAQLQRFKREAEIMARLPHRHICRVYDFNEFEGVSYIAMEFVDGLTLADLLYGGDYAKPGDREPGAAASLPELIRSVRSLREMPQFTEPVPDTGPKAPKTSRILPVEQTIAIIGKICDAVQFAHEHGVLHRDLKPGNILLREDGEPLVADFGLAKIDGAGEGGSASLSLSGHVVGTVENMAPEQAMSSKAVDGRADVFSIGTILYQLLTGHKFFTATGNLLADAQALQTYDPHRPRVLNRRIDPDLEIITMKALRPDRADRYRTVSALKADLERFERGEHISARPIHPGELLKKLVLRHKAITAVSAVSLLILTLGLGLAAWNNNDRRIEAEHERQLADKARLEAEAGRTEAIVARKLAEDQKAAADRSLAELELARQAEKQAIGLHEKAVAEAHQYSQEKDQAEAEREKLAQLTQAQASELKNTQARLDKLKTQTHRSPDPDEKKQLVEAQEKLNETITNYQFAFSPKGLAELKSGSDVLKTVNSMMDSLAAVLDATPDNLDALMIKTRLYIGMLEIDSARMTLRRAVEIATAHPEYPGGGEVRPLGEILASLGGAGNPSPEELASALRRTGDALDRPAAGLLETMHAYTATRRPSATESVFGREPTNAEIASNLRLSNPQIGPVKVSRDADGHLSVEIPNAVGTVDLGALRNLDVQVLRIHGATDLDWPALHALPVATLDLDGCGIVGLGTSPQNRGLLRVRSLSVARTKIADLREIAQLPMLGDLDISDTPIRSLLPLSGRRLQRLAFAGCAAGPLSVLDWMPLNELVLSPALCAGLKEDTRLRASRTLRSIRAPEDPEPQTAADFWKKIDADAYARAAVAH